MPEIEVRKKTRVVPTVVLGVTMALGFPALSNAQASSQDQDAIRNVVSGMENAWNQGDAKALAQYFTSEAEVIDIMGGIHAGRNAIERQNAVLLGDMFGGSHLSQQVRRTTFLRPEVALVDADAQLYGYKSLPKGFVAAGNVITVRMRHVMVYGDGKWRIVASQFTYVAPPPMPE
jgi:uncharacterized protein (TIGR02246 family)